MFQVAAFQWWASPSFISNGGFCPPCPSWELVSESVGTSPPVEDTWLRNGRWVYQENSQPCTHSIIGRDRAQSWEFIWGCSRAHSIESLYQVPDSVTDAWRLNGIAPDDAQRLRSNAWNKIVLPINFLSYLIFPHGVSFPCWIWPTPCSVQCHYGKGLPIAIALPGVQPDGTVLCASGLLISLTVGMRSGNSGERSRAKPGLWGVNLLHTERSAIIVHNDLFFHQDKCFWHKTWEAPFSSDGGGSSSWYILPDKSKSISTWQTNSYTTLQVHSQDYPKEPVPVSLL